MSNVCGISQNGGLPNGNDRAHFNLSCDYTDLFLIVAGLLTTNVENQYQQNNGMSDGEAAVSGDPAALQAAEESREDSRRSKQQL